MRVPGNERAFTVSPTRGIPFPQLVCIGETDGQSQAFPVSAWARPAAALLELARAPPRATVRSPGRDSVAAPTAPAPAPTPTPHTHAHASMFARSQAQVQTPRLTATSAAALAPGGFVGAQRRHGRPPSRRPRDRNREAGRAWGPRAAPGEALGLEISGRETPCVPWTHSCHREAPGTRAGCREWSPGSLALRSMGQGSGSWEDRVGFGRKRAGELVAGWGRL